MFFFLFLAYLLLIIAGFMSYSAASAIQAGLVVGALPFWALAGIEGTLLLWCLSEDDDWFGTSTATVSVVLTLLLFQLFSIYKPFTYIWHHPGRMALSACIYFLIGAAWSVGKWWFAEREGHRLAVREWQKSKTAPPLFPGRPEVSWPEFVKHRRGDPVASSGRLTGWIMYWPLSMTWTLVNDPLRRFARQIYQQLLGTYQRISDHIWAQPS